MELTILRTLRHLRPYESTFAWKVPKISSPHRHAQPADHSSEAQLSSARCSMYSAWVSAEGHQQDWVFLRSFRRNLSHTLDCHGARPRVRAYPRGRTPVAEATCANGRSDFPVANTKTVYVKELFFKSHDLECFEGVIRDFKEVQKQVRSRENEEEIKAQHAENQTGEKFLERKGGPSIRDVSMRPSMGSARSRPVWNLEAHANGFRCSVRGSATEKLEVLYSQIKVAIFQPCEKRSLLVLIHFHLNEPIMVNRRKTLDLQFYTEVRAQTEDLSMRRSANAYDPDEIIQEQREEEMKERLNKVFRDFVQKVEAQHQRLRFEMPSEEGRVSTIAPTVQSSSAANPSSQSRSGHP
ncbi:FACT complex subunit SPT16 (Chromatin-specific transcription elongation factor 140 kDa subunit) (FACT 140 kDa subunit) (FACTp140) (Facilitates chromatin transcription complex subunit SPT16) (hSPT16) [Durusdinium trenchii]|uniref:FACT complex subunit n=1 Tax=Durusdinium trenchii TaxID=1381693 RepID=A0ABP0NSS2_9DINO